MQPLIRWAGSKSQLISRLRSYWPGGRTRYIEPFAGSARLFFELKPRNAILGDLNWELILAYRVLKADPESVFARVRRYRASASAYYSARRLDPRLLSEVEIAARFFYLNRYCFNGLYRTNSRGGFNVPYSYPKRSRPFQRQSLVAASSLLRNAQLRNSDFEATALLARPGDFVYFDPPYAVSTRRLFSEYVPGSFSTRDLVRLRRVLRALDARGSQFLVTYADSLEGRGLLKGWPARRIRVRRNISGFAHSRGFSFELVATNIRVRDKSNG